MPLVRPFGVVMNGELVLGVQLRINNGIIEEIGPHTGIPEPYIISPAFVNAHSHFEYRGMQGSISHPEYYEWIWELTRLKQTEAAEEVEKWCQVAAAENRATGVALVGEHSDRPGSAAAMVANGLGGWIYQELIDFTDEDKEEKYKFVLLKLTETQSKFSDASLNPHAFHTVSAEGHERIISRGEPISIHLGETVWESLFTENGVGKIAEGRQKMGIPFEILGASVFECADQHGLLSERTQVVHACDARPSDIELLARRQVSIAHCPRSNERLKCPKAPIREYLDAGLNVGLGMDSAASGGPIDMFAEMRAALAVSYERGRPLRPEEVWRMATTMGYRSFGKPGPEPWDIYEGSSTPLIKIEVPGINTLEEFIDQGSPACVSFLD